MKMIFTDPSVVPCDMVRGVLEGSGIGAIIKNERGSAAASVGYPMPRMISLTFAWPEVWVADDDYTAAVGVLAEMKASHVSSDLPWKCRRCGETVDSELAVCWNCDTPQDEETT